MISCLQCQYVPDIAIECHPPAATHFILTPVRSSTRQGCSLVSMWPNPSWPRLKIIKNIISEKCLKKEQKFYWKMCFVVLHLSFWILEHYIFWYISHRKYRCTHLSEQICKQILNLIINAMHIQVTMSWNWCVD